MPEAELIGGTGGIYIMSLYSLRIVGGKVLRNDRNRA